MTKRIINQIISVAMAAAMVFSSSPVCAIGQEQQVEPKQTTISWKDLYESLGVTNTSDEEGYYDAVTSATQFGSFHAKDIPAIVNRVVSDNSTIIALDGVNLSEKEKTVTPVVKSATYTDSSKYGTGEFVIVPDDTVEGYVWNDYFANLYAATISNGETTVGCAPWIDYYGESATSGPHYNKVQISLNTGISTGSNKAVVKRYDAFYDENKNLKPGTYTVTLYSEGYEDLSANITVLEYEYMYASLSWSEYWAAENVYGAGLNQSNEEKDAKGELDKGAFDAVSRATTNHGLHRGSFTSSAVIYDVDGNSYPVSHWSADGKNIVLTDGSTIGFAKGVITKADSTTARMDHYEVTGFKYVPVRVAKEDAESFKKAYRTVANGEKLYGGYSEQQLVAFEKIACVDKTTNGLKTVTKNEDGSFSFAVATSGIGSGFADEEQAKVDMEKLTVTVKEANGSYGEFLRVDLTGDAYGDLGSKMYAVIWKYYADTNPSTNRRAAAKATYGTKFAADNWMHKSMGIQLGLTESERCVLPEGTDGTGYWQMVVKALGYADTTINFEVTAENIVKPVHDEVVDTAVLQQLIDNASKLEKDEYTKQSWEAMQAELDESVELLKKEKLTQAQVDEQTTHLKDAVEKLVKNNKPETQIEQTPTENKKEEEKKPDNTKTETDKVETKTEEKITVSTIKIESVSKKVAATKKVALTALVLPENASNKAVVWETSNEKYATVNEKGVVKTKKAGAGKTVIITAKAADGSKVASSIKLSIVKDCVKSISLKASKKTVNAGKKVNVKATVKVTGKTANKALAYTSSNTKYATVNAKGVVKTTKAGKGHVVKITATAKDGSGKKATVSIKIK